MGGGVLPAQLKPDGIFYDNEETCVIFGLDETCKPPSITIDGKEVVHYDGFRVVFKFGEYPENPWDGEVIGKELYSLDDVFWPIIIVHDNIPIKEEPPYLPRRYSFFTKSSQNSWSEPLKLEITSEIREKDILRGFTVRQKDEYADPYLRQYYRLTYNNNQKGLSNGNVYFRPDLPKTEENIKRSFPARYFLTHILKVYPAVVNDDGTVRFWLDPYDFSKKADGSIFNGWDDVAFDGNICAWVSFFQPGISGWTNETGYNDINFYVSTNFELYKNGSGNEIFKDWMNQPLKGVWIPLFQETEYDVNTIPRYRSVKKVKKADIQNIIDSFQSLPYTNRRVPMGYIEKSVFSWLIGYFLGQTNSQEVFGKYYLYDHEPVSNNLSIPSFSRGNYAEGETKYPARAFYSKIFVDNPGCSSLCLADYYKSATIDNKYNYEVYVDRNHKYIRGVEGATLTKYSSKYADFPEPSIFSQYTKSFWYTGGMLSNEAVLFPMRQRGTATAGSSTYYCDGSSFYNPNQLIGKKFLLNQWGNSSSDIAGIFYTAIEMEETLSNDAYFSYSVMVLPPPDYDPFEATNYKPWEDWLEDPNLKPYL